MADGGVPVATRATLNRTRVLRAAVSLADEAGLDALSMRRLGQRLGVEAMSLYNHVASKEDLLDGHGRPGVRRVRRTGPWPGLAAGAAAHRDVGPRGPAAVTRGRARSSSPGRASGPARLRYLNGVVGSPGRLGVPDPAGVPRGPHPGQLHLRVRAAGGVRARRRPARRPRRPRRSSRGCSEGEYPHLVAMARLVMHPGYDRSRGLRLRPHPGPRRPRPPARPRPAPGVARGHPTAPVGLDDLQGKVLTS